MQDKIPDLLYHTTLTISHYREDTGGTTQTFYVLGTHSNLPSAKAFAKKALQSQGFEISDFPTYEVRQPEQPWIYGDGVLVYAKALGGEELLVGIDTKPNEEELVEGPCGTVRLPKGTNHLHYVVQTEINYNQSPDTRYHTHEIEGCFAHRAAAYEAARDCLADGKDEFAQYDERQNLDQMPDWPFGDDVLVHAVSQTGQNYTVAVKTVPEPFVDTVEVPFNRHTKKHEMRKCGPTVTVHLD